MARIRLDNMVLKRKLADSLVTAQELIKSGKILVNGSVQLSANSFVEIGSAIEVTPEKSKYVSRGGLKLEHALAEFNIDPTGKRCLDIGASTGGFSDCLLQARAKHVVALDVGHGQLDLSLRNNENITVIEKTNAKDIDEEMIGGKCQLGVMDVSFTSVSRLIESVAKCLEPKEMVVLIKPQFECEPKFVDSRGVVNDANAQIECIINVQKNLPTGLVLLGLAASPIKGAKGNIEFLAYLTDAKHEIPMKRARIESIVRNSATDMET